MLKTHWRLHEEARGDGIWKLCAGMALGGACALRAYGKAAADVSSSLIQKCSDNVCFFVARRDETGIWTVDDTVCIALVSADNKNNWHTFMQH